MKTLEYEVVIEDSGGRARQTLMRTATTGRPLVGEEMVVDGALYEVRRVRHLTAADDLGPRRRDGPPGEGRTTGGCHRDPGPLSRAKE